MVPRKTERHFVELLSVLSGMGIVSRYIAFLVKICLLPILLHAKANARFHSDYSFGVGASLGPVARSTDGTGLTIGSEVLKPICFYGIVNG